MAAKVFITIKYTPRSQLGSETNTNIIIITIISGARICTVYITIEKGFKNTLGLISYSKQTIIKGVFHEI